MRLSWMMERSCESMSCKLVSAWLDSIRYERVSATVVRQSDFIERTMTFLKVSYCFAK